MHRGRRRTRCRSAAAAAATPGRPAASSARRNARARARPALPAGPSGCPGRRGDSALRPSTPAVRECAARIRSVPPHRRRRQSHQPSATARRHVRRRNPAGRRAAQPFALRAATAAPSMPSRRCRQAAGAPRPARCPADAAAQPVRQRGVRTARCPQSSSTATSTSSDGRFGSRGYSVASACQAARAATGSRRCSACRASLRNITSRLCSKMSSCMSGIARGLVVGHFADGRGRENPAHRINTKHVLFENQPGTPP